jgi:hypothetical protein
MPQPRSSWRKWSQCCGQPTKTHRIATGVIHPHSGIDDDRLMVLLMIRDGHKGKQQEGDDQGRRPRQRSGNGY